jgi:hypothetical protein
MSDYCEVLVTSIDSSNRLSAKNSVFTLNASIRHQGGQATDAETLAYK